MNPQLTTVSLESLQFDLFVRLKSELPNLGLDIFEAQTLFKNFCKLVDHHLISITEYSSYINVLSIDKLVNSANFNMSYGTDSWLQNMILDNPDRFNRIQNAAYDGYDGSTHREYLEDIREYIDDIFVFNFTRELQILCNNSDYLEIIDAYVSLVVELLKRELSKCEQWHLDNGSLDKIIG